MAAKKRKTRMHDAKAHARARSANCMEAGASTAISTAAGTAIWSLNQLDLLKSETGPFRQAPLGTLGALPFRQAQGAERELESLP